MSSAGWRVSELIPLGVLAAARNRGASQPFSLDPIPGAPRLVVRTGLLKVNGIQGRVLGSGVSTGVGFTPHWWDVDPGGVVTDSNGVQVATWLDWWLPGFTAGEALFTESRDNPGIPKPLTPAVAPGGFMLSIYNWRNAIVPTPGHTHTWSGDQVNPGGYRVAWTLGPPTTTSWGTNRYHVQAAIALNPVSDGYISTAWNMGALLLQDGFTNVGTGQPFTKMNTVTSVGTDPYGHKALLADSANSYLSASVLLPTSYTMVGATSLVDGSPQTASRLIAVGDSFLGYSIGRTRTGTIRHVFTDDPGNWHWFAMTVDGTNPAETSIIYRDGEQFGDPITRDDDSRAALSTVSVLMGGLNSTQRNIGHFSACAVFDSALTPAQIADLYAAYQKGPS